MDKFSRDEERKAMEMMGEMAERKAIGTSGFPSHTPLSTGYGFGYSSTGREPEPETSSSSEGSTLRLEDFSDDSGEEEKERDDPKDGNKYLISVGKDGKIFDYETQRYYDTKEEAQMGRLFSFMAKNPEDARGMAEAEVNWEEGGMDSRHFPIQ